MKGSEVVFSKGYGLSDLKSRQPVTSKTLFNIGSVSKTFVSNAILILESQGKLSVEDSLAKYFSFEKKEIGEAVRIKHLLTHTSGLPDIRNVNADSVFYLTAKDEENWAPILKAKRLNFEPGSRFEYSNPAFNGLALIIETVSGMKWQQFVKLNIFQPSQMHHSTITDGSHPTSGVAHGYVNNNGNWIEDDYGEEPTFPAAGNGGVWSSAEELARYELAIRKGRFLDPGVIRASRAPKKFNNWKGTGSINIGWSIFKSQNIDDPFIGWSWFITENDHGLKMIGHTGTQGGFMCNYATIPEKEIFFVILCNSPRDLHAFNARIISAFNDSGWMD